MAPWYSRPARPCHAPRSPPPPPASGAARRVRGPARVRPGGYRRDHAPDEDAELAAASSGSTPASTSSLAEARRREHEAVVGKRLRFRGAAGPRAQKIVASRDRPPRPWPAPRLPVHRPPRIGARNQVDGRHADPTRPRTESSDLGKGPDDVAARRRARDPAFAGTRRSASRCPHRVGSLDASTSPRAVNDPERDDALSSKATIAPIRPRSSASAVQRPGAAPGRWASDREPGGALDHHGISLAHASSFGGVLAHPDVEPFDHGAEQRLEARASASRQSDRGRRCRPSTRGR